MELKLRRYEDIAIVDLAGEVDLYHSHLVKEAIGRLMERGVMNQVINMDAVSYIDSSGVGALIYANAALRKTGARLWIVNLRGPVRRVIELTRLIGYLPIADSIQQAVERIRHPQA